MVVAVREDGYLPRVQHLIANRVYFQPGLQHIVHALTAFMLVSNKLSAEISSVVP